VASDSEESDAWIQHCSGGHSLIFMPRLTRPTGLPSAALDPSLLGSRAPCDLDRIPAADTAA